jgi:hypothetical protein
MESPGQKEVELVSLAHLLNRPCTSYDSPAERKSAGELSCSIEPLTSDNSPVESQEKT